MFYSCSSSYQTAVVTLQSPPRTSKNTSPLLSSLIENSKNSKLTLFSDNLIAYPALNVDRETMAHYICRRTHAWEKAYQPSANWQL